MLSANKSASLSHDFGNIGILENSVKNGVLDASHVARDCKFVRRDVGLSDGGLTDAESGIRARGSGRLERAD